ncbi:Zn-finger containing NTP pyrophosphohydrolase [Mizugakiibacter sediminis]|uniref:NAD(+) diphosphatase n=1 Tax=Mizugakiibacter sediminis TaxID=1475481 RepID=A0A0K8QLE9_9GAMM|nr:NAD(+) diphosphatase [Mizugakiibacter sediminis]GAP65760.1 Zn-finger containing NTP pyrophosphohydrolase [Mizugakiibacter sediminis]
MSSAARSHRNPLAAPAALDRLAERRDDEAWLAARAGADDARFLLLDAEQRMLAARDGTRLALLTAAQRARLLPDAAAHFLGAADGLHYFFLDAAGTADALAQTLDARWAGLRELGMSLDPLAAGLCAYAKGLAHWQAATRHCSRCGAPLALIAAGHRAACGSCGALHFPRTDPAVIVIVEHEGACLLGRQAGWPEKRYSTLAGFVEPGETLEQAVRREVAEEAGVEVLDCDYHSSQPWPFPGSLMLGFTATAARRDIRLADGELEDARWFTAAEIVAALRAGELRLSPSISVSYRLIEHWLAGQGIDLAAELAALPS